MEALFHDIVALLLRLGPWLVFVVTATETAFFIGLLIPAEATVLLAAFLADLGYFSLTEVLAATLIGGFVGDQIGFLLGRYGGYRVAAAEGRIGRLWRRHERAATALFQRRSIVAVSLARFVSFLRTLMPWFAGMSGMPWRRFVVYDLIGVIGWGGLSVLAGFAAGRSWRVVANAFGTVSGIVLALLLLFAIVMFRRSRRRGRLYRVGLTGNIASGKSTVADVWQRLGARIIDADELARAAVAPGTPALRQIRARFGDAVIAPDGTLDRAALRDRVFGDPAERRALEAIVHPVVQRLRLAAEQRLASGGARMVVHVIPLLFEIGMQDQVDTVVLVDAEPAQRRARIVRDRGVTPEAADAMIAAQLPAEEKRMQASYVLRNDGALGDLELEAERLWRELSARVSA
ncbi:MAG TPA: dephospho-CoA kinase [Longimicrobiales bacterium]|nr:dephospho-CoA kinase [Longimicrobiales bacterium]